MTSKETHTLIMLRANIRERKEKRIFVLTETNVYPQLSLEVGLHIMNRCGFPLWAGEGLNQAAFIDNGEGIACYQKREKEIVLALLFKRHPIVSEDIDISIYPDDPESFHLSGLSGSKLDMLFEGYIMKANAGKRLSRKYVEETLRKARLSLVPEGWTVVTDGDVKSGDRYLSEDRTKGYFTLIPAIVSWTSCDVSFSAHKPGTPVKKNGWDESIIIRKAN